jgi:hypothetical protein
VNAGGVAGDASACASLDTTRLLDASDTERSRDKTEEGRAVEEGRTASEGRGEMMDGRRIDEVCVCESSVVALCVCEVGEGPDA